MKMKVNVKRYFQVLGISLSVIIVAAAICMGINYDKFNELGGGDTVMPDVDNGIINVLALGVDVDGLRTDAMMVFSYNTATKNMNVLTVPRDTKMFVGNRYQKINAAHAFVKDGKIGGPEATVEAIQRVTGIPINFYIEFDFDAVAHVVNILGPIEFTIPDIYGDGVGMVYDDPVQSLHINLPPGKYGEGDDCDYPGLNGSQAVHVMRYRHGNPDPVTNIFKSYPNGDEDRTKVQQEFIKAIVDQKLNASLITKMPEIYQELKAEIKTNITFSDILKYASNLTGLSSVSMHSYTLPGWYGNDTNRNNGDIWVVDLPATKELIQNVFGYDASGISINAPDGRDPSGVSGYYPDDYAGKDFNGYYDSVDGYSGAPATEYSESTGGIDSVGGTQYQHDGSMDEPDGYTQSWEAVDDSDYSDYSDYDDYDDYDSDYSDYDYDDDDYDYDYDE